MFRQGVHCSKLESHGPFLRVRDFMCVEKMVIVKWATPEYWTLVVLILLGLGVSSLHKVTWPSVT